MTLFKAVVAVMDLDEWLENNTVNTIEGFTYVADLGAVLILYT